MSRPKTEVNPIRAERVKTLLEREQITQRELAKRIFQSQQNVSRIMKNHQPLTEETAKLIVKAFPDYRLEWLLGYDEFMTADDFWDTRQLLRDRTADGMWAIIETSMRKHGMSLRFVHRVGEHIDSAHRARADCYYSIVDNAGNELKRMTAVEMIEFELKLQEYCDFMVERHLLP